MGNAGQGARLAAGWAPGSLCAEDKGVLRPLTAGLLLALSHVAVGHAAPRVSGCTESFDAQHLRVLTIAP